MDEVVVNKLNDLKKDIIQQENEVRLDGDDVLPDVADPNTVMEEVTKCMRTPRATLYEQNETPGGSIYWEPHVEGIPIPVEGTYYDTIDEALDMYTKYAKIVGFEIKKGGQRLTKSRAVQHKYIYCNKEGVPKGINVDTLDPEYSDKQKRNTTTHVTGYKARIRLVRNTLNGRYKLEQFQPKHNHMLIPKEYKHFTKKQRKMNQLEKMFVVKAATNKIGATRTHNLLCSMKGRVENSELVAMFWADEVVKCNYKEFGDIVSFDATFNSNKYNMKFVPFIGIDNHGKCVTLGSGMLLHEDTKSYTWLLNAFMTAFSHEPTMIVTDQDGAMKRAIEAVFKKAKHRLCMWHIMQKIPSKICKEIYDETNFKERFDKIVWNMFIEPLKFEEKWSELIEDFGLQSHKWLTKMFNLREIWIPAYFIDSPLYGLMRTTSRSESENSFFKSFTSPGATLVSFMMSYESAMERQSKDEGKMGAYVEKLKILLDEVKVDMPNPPSRNTRDVIGVRHVIHSESHEIHPESHEIQSESHEIQSESLWITSDSL
ncbi:FAR1-related sequence 5-like protein [Tanacetum coccineum]